MSFLATNLISSRRGAVAPVRWCVSRCATPVLANGEWKRAKYRLTHLGIKELDDLMEAYTRRYEQVFAEAGEAEPVEEQRRQWFAARLPALQALCEIDSQALWTFLFNGGRLERRWLKNEAFLAFLAHVHAERAASAGASCGCF